MVDAHAKATEGDAWAFIYCLWRASDRLGVYAASKFGGLCSRGCLRHGLSRRRLIDREHLAARRRTPCGSGMIRNAQIFCRGTREKRP